MHDDWTFSMILQAINQMLSNALNIMMWMFVFDLDPDI